MQGSIFSQETAFPRRTRLGQPLRLPRPLRRESDREGDQFDEGYSLALAMNEVIKQEKRIKELEAELATAKAQMLTDDITQ